MHGNKQLKKIKIKSLGRGGFKPQTLNKHLTSVLTTRAQCQFIYFLRFQIDIAYLKR
jgi:hypothetical protein